MISDAAIWTAICNRRAAVLELTGREEPARDTVHEVADAHDLDPERVRQIYREHIACMIGG